MTISEAFDIVLRMAKAEYDNSIEESSEAELRQMQEAITLLENWLCFIEDES